MKKCISILICSALLLALGCGAFAMVQGDIDEHEMAPGLKAALDYARQVIEADRGKTLEELSDENNANYYHYNPYGHTVPPEPAIAAAKDQTWDDIVSMLFEKYGISPDEPNIALTYYNTVTGESYRYNADKYFVTASVFKVPLCMLVAEKVSAGEISMDEQIAGWSFSNREWRALAHSDNQAALDLENYLGGFVEFRNQAVKFYGEDPRDDIGDYTYYESYNTASQIENCLKMLYAEPEKYPGVLENMLIDTPYEYFKMWDRRYPTAQKWGYVPHTDEMGNHDFVNNVGIIYTDQPIILTVFTDNLPGGYDVIGEYATLMIDYTNFRTEEYKVLETAAREEARATLDTRSLADYYKAPAMTARVSTGEKTEVESRMSVFATLLMLLILSAMVLACVFIFRRNQAGRIRARWAVPAILVAGLALLLCVIAVNRGTLVAKPEGDPQEAVRGFFDNLQTGNYETAYGYLSNYSDLGLQNEPDTEEGRLVYDALRQSWSYSVTEPCVQDKLNATQPVSFRYLDLNQLEKDAAGRIDGILNEIVQSRPQKDVYDADNHYLPEVTDEVYLTALTEALKNASLYYKVADLNVNLSYEDGRWLMAAGPELISALLGGTN